MPKLILKRRHRDRLTVPGQTVIKINNAKYNKILDVADENGLSIREVASRMVAFAYENTEYGTEDEEVE